ncbi:MAG: methionine--tRNA ligase subunit beta [Candidatus Daviesbacteria bacterium]|nr:methionine--tRNA ligase subunit beta [Candidatus Daviesbacteria bacterium]
MITIDDFSKVELKIGTIITAEEVEGSEKLIKFQIDLGEETRQILSGVKKWYSPEKLIGKQVVVVTNLEPRMMMGLESNGMILFSDGEKPIFLKPASKTPSGTKVR